jgi:hypothetical protein
MMTQYVPFQHEWRVRDDNRTLLAVYWPLTTDTRVTWYVRVVIDGELTPPHKCDDRDACVEYLAQRLVIQALEAP